ncbi:Oxo-4-hydroxy-4-carboxy-5-ureidoimidazoline decarboxylase [Limtongia smithiae]|uniref:Oxo-4-hydroxy-4-carboxy-5-ureidoimidazoline decarboxylase n=1 Tax=Limtongia smithiae TaxID=1125753 RepID=UPI0034CEE64D
MSTYALPKPDSFRTLSVADRAEILEHLFERSQALESLLYPEFANAVSYGDLIEHARTALLTLTAESRANTSAKANLLEILAAHPRLGARKVDSVYSVQEQASLQGEAESLRVLNTEYEEKFPGLRYVVFVNGRPREVIMENMRQRIERGDYEKETLEALNAMCEIARDRAAKLGAQL